MRMSWPFPCRMTCTCWMWLLFPACCRPCPLPLSSSLPLADAMPAIGVAIDTATTAATTSFRTYSTLFLQVFSLMYSAKTICVQHAPTILVVVGVLGDALTPFLRDNCILRIEAIACLC